MLPIPAWLSRREAQFWMVQAIVWSAYGATLMVPWIGTYTIAVMLPNKLAIAGTGLVTSAALRLIYKEARSRRVAPDKLLVVAAGASAVGGWVWSGWSAVMIGADVPTIWRSFSTLAGGVPHLGGPLYSALVLLSWSLAYLTSTRPFVTARARRTVQVIDHDVPSGLITVRDGDKALVIDPRELAWMQAERDYVRLHTRRKSHLIRTTMTQLESTLASGCYVRIHRSTIVNVSWIREVEPHTNSELFVVLRDGTRLKASRNYAKRLREALGLGPQPGVGGSH